MLLLSQAQNEGGKSSEQHSMNRAVHRSAEAGDWRRIALMKLGMFNSWVSFESGMEPLVPSKVTSGCRKSATRSSSAAAIRDTSDLLIPVAPIASTNSSTRRVETGLRTARRAALQPPILAAF